MKDLALLEMLNQYPVAGALLLGILVVSLQIYKIYKGKADATRVETETNKFVRQTNETVNQCAARTQATVDAVDRLLEEGNFRSLHAKYNETVSMLEKMGDIEKRLEDNVARIDRMVNDITITLDRNDSRVVHSNIINKVEHMQSVIDDVKRIVVDIGNNNLRNK